LKKIIESLNRLITTITTAPSWQNDFANLPDYYQTFFRNYDQALGRFIAIDPLAEQSESLTGYQYSVNNPIMFNDPLGDRERPQLMEMPKEVDSGGEAAASYWEAYLAMVVEIMCSMGLQMLMQLQN
jgi:RHS repeat-associated protein